MERHASARRVHTLRVLRLQVSQLASKLNLGTRISLWAAGRFSGASSYVSATSLLNKGEVNSRDLSNFDVKPAYLNSNFHAGLLRCLDVVGPWLSTPVGRWRVVFVVVVIVVVVGRLAWIVVVVVVTVAAAVILAVTILVTILVVTIEAVGGGSASSPRDAG